ncbi:unnamed protein product [Jaminaea pallidilutea]
MDSSIALSCESPDCIMGTVVVAKDSRTYVSVRPQSHGTAKGCGNGGHGIWTFAPIYARGYGTMTASYSLVSITLSCQPVRRQPSNHKEGEDYVVVGDP